MRNKDERFNKLCGALIGFAIGDAMGATTEFMSKEDIKREYGRVENILGGGWLGLKAGEVTDDTQMTMCVIDAILKTEDFENVPAFIEKVGLNFIKWKDSDPKDIGNACRYGIEHFRRTHERAIEDNSALGNGGLMRALPCALIDRLELNWAQNDITHNNEECRSNIKKYQEVIKRMLECETYPAPSALCDNGGKVDYTLNNALYFALGAKSFSSAVIEAVNDGGDADTIGAITGSIAGARFGLNSVPTSWVETLNQDVVGKLRAFAEFCLTIEN